MPLAGEGHRFGHGGDGHELLDVGAGHEPFGFAAGDDHALETAILLDGLEERLEFIEQAKGQDVELLPGDIETTRTPSSLMFCGEHPGH